MSDTYFLGREQDGDEDGIYPESVYDGHIWAIDPDLPDDPERGPNEPEIAVSISDEHQAEWVLSVIQERDKLRLDIAVREATIHMAASRLGGVVEGRPTHTGNFLQRIDELRRIEAEAKMEAAPVPEHEELARKFREQTRDGEHGPEGTRESLERTAKMLDTWGPECFPANELGQVHFARAMMDGAADEIRAFLGREPMETALLSSLEALLPSVIGHDIPGCKGQCKTCQDRMRAVALIIKARTI